MLKYIFLAIYADGSSYWQNDNDISETDPLRSCFYDVKQDQLVAFKLEGEGHRYSVNLTTGAFSVDGVVFRMHEEILTNFKLIYFRRHTHSINALYEELAHQVVYRFGWQATDETGKVHQRVMEID